MASPWTGAGNAYVTGITYSTDFPLANPLQASHGGGGNDAFVAKLNSTGSALIYSTYLGGSGADHGNGIAVDGAGNAYVIGDTSSTDFPTANPLQPTNHGGQRGNAFVAKFNPSGSALIYSTYLGGSGGEAGSGIAADNAGNTHVTGITQSTDFPTANPVQPALAGNADAFVAKLNPTGSALLFSTYLGGSRDEEGFGIAVDGAGNAYVTGATDSNDFPTVNALQPQLAGGENAFVVKFALSGP